MLTAVVTGPDLFSAKRQIKDAGLADAIEIRLDCLDAIDLIKIQKLQKYWNKTVIFSLRRKQHGGKYLQHDNKLYFDLSRLFSLKPNYFDLESDISVDFLMKMTKEHPDVKIITSYHNFENTPDDLKEVLKSIRNPYATFYKIATQAKNSIDSLKVLEFLKENNDGSLIAIPMGDNGSFVRVISKIYGNKITYANVDKKNALGQISLEDLLNVYNYRKIDSDTKIYALIGYPLDNSLGHLYHNDYISKKNINAVYVKINLQAHELPVFFTAIKKFPFVGFSVTMPLKENVLSFIDEDKANVGSINTILIKDQKLIGYNTDGIAAIDSIEKKIKIKDKRVLLIGAGGVAKAIAYEAVKRKANLSIFNRDQKKAYDLASKLQCKAFPLERIKDVMKEGYDVIINATSTGMEDVDIIPAECLISGTIAMDVVSKPIETPFLKNAQQRGCLVIYGMEMFINQANMQFENN
ncbi:MAG: shikimate dehydrogenase [Parachlamydiales bacterium]|jgi:3-dehydroquinate dehydratase/shikimate dehydrogenase